MTLATFNAAMLINADFSGALLQGVQFQRADLTGAIFENAILKHCNFSGADLTGVHFTPEQQNSPGGFSHASWHDLPATQHVG